jgi:hypothetical protein
MEQCESCGSEKQWELKSMYGDKTYGVCSNCLTNLVGLNLSKKQFKALLKAGHTDDEFLLHEDFYDEQGNALQPECG